MIRTHAIISALVVSLASAGCGGSSGSGSTTPPSGGGGGTTPVNPCSTALEADQPTASLSSGAGGQSAGTEQEDPDRRQSAWPRVQEAMWIHQAAEEEDRQRNPGRQSATADTRTGITTPAQVAEDIGEIAIVQDAGDLILPAHTFDLVGAGLRFTRNGSNGYSVARDRRQLSIDLGTSLTLGDDDSASVAVPFSFPFYGWLADGRVRQLRRQHHVRRGRPGEHRARRLTVADRTAARGSIPRGPRPDSRRKGLRERRRRPVHRDLVRRPRLRFPAGRDGAGDAPARRRDRAQSGDTVTLGDAVVGLSPGQTGDFTTMDLSTATPPSGTGAVGERFAAAATFDAIAASKKFFTAHPDNYDQVLLWTDQPVIRDAFAYETTAQNEIRGIGVDVYDLSPSVRQRRASPFPGRDGLAGQVSRTIRRRSFSARTTRSASWARRSAIAGSRISTSGTTQARDRTALLGRDLAHWSFFFNSDASVMEGNQIEDQGAASSAPSMR